MLVDVPLLVARGASVYWDDDPACQADTDGDGLLDAYETDTRIFVSDTDTGTDPLSADTDGDGYADGDEVAAGTNPNVPNPAPVPTLGLWGRALLLLLLVAAAAGSRLRSRRLP
jgi:hypothetical protein